MPTMAAAKASGGAIRAGITTLPSRPPATMALGPPPRVAAPTRPPISACDELDGRPKYHVIRFQPIAPIRPANTIVGVIASDLTIPLPTVAATLREMNAPAKLSSAAKPTANRGDIARVEIEVATTLAVS